MAKLEDVVQSLMDWDTNGLNENTSKLAFIKAQRRLKEEGMPLDQQDAVLGELSQRIKADTVQTGQEGVYKFRSDLTKKDQMAQGGFENWASNKRAQLIEQGIRDQERAVRAASLEASRADFGFVVDELDTDLDTGLEALKAHMGDVQLNLQKGGFSESEIKQELSGIEKDGLKVAFNTILRNDPTQAMEFASEFADVFGKEVVNLKDEARRESQRLEKARAEAEVEVAKVSLKDLNADQIAEIGAQEGPAGEAARKMARQLQQEPHKIVEKDLMPLNANIPESLGARVEHIQRTQEQYSTPNRPVNIPLFSPKEISAIKDMSKLDIRKTNKTLKFLSQLKAPELLKAAREFEDHPLGEALRIYKNNPATAKRIIEGIASPNEEKVKDIDLEGLGPYADPSSNAALFESVKALSKVEDGSAEDLIDRVVNRQTLRRSWGFPVKAPVPAGFTGEQFQSKLEDILSDPARMREYANGEVLGGAAVGATDVEVVLIRHGIYGLRKNDRWLATEDGNMLQLNMIEALEDE